MSQMARLRDYRSVRLAWRALNRQLERICARDGPQFTGCRDGPGGGTNVPRARDSQQLEAVAARMAQCRTMLRCLSPPVGDALRAIPDPRTRQLMRLYYVQGRTVPEIAVRLGVSTRTVYRLLRRGEEGCSAREGQVTAEHSAAQHPTPHLSPAPRYGRTDDTCQSVSPRSSCTSSRGASPGSVGGTSRSG